MDQLEEYLRDLEEIVSFDSGTGNFAGVRRAAEIMKRHYESIGFQASLIDLGPKAGPGLFASNKPGADHFDILFSAHLDTVFPDGAAAERPFARLSDRVTAPGCMDCKGGVIAFFHALKTLEPEVLSRLSVAVALNPDEETGSLSSRKWLLGLARKSSCALVGEPGRPGNEMIRSRKGIWGFTVKFSGLASHAGNHPELGRDANLALMRFTLEAVKMNDPAAGVSISPTMMKGGSIPNAISDASEIYFDTRFRTPEQEAAVENGIRDLMTRDWVEGVTLSLEEACLRPPMPFTEKDRPFFDLVAAAAAGAGFEAKWEDAGGGSDGCWMAKAGIPAVDGCGPAGGGAHSKTEYLLTETVLPRIEMVKNVLRRL